MPTKTYVKKTKKTSHKTKGLQTSDLKPVKVNKITQATIEANFARIQKSQDEAWAAIRETQKNIGGLNNTLGSMVERNKPLNYLYKE